MTRGMTPEHDVADQRRLGSVSLSESDPEGPMPSPGPSAGPATANRFLSGEGGEGRLLVTLDPEQRQVALVLTALDGLTWQDVLSVRRSLNALLAHEADVRQAAEAALTESEKS